MKYAVIDTETSGLFDFSKPAEAEGQPRLASLAIILLDEALAETKRFNIFVKPDGWALTPEVTAIHGLTNEFLDGAGVPVRQALDKYLSVLDGGYYIVAFNSIFDTKIMRGELRRAGLPDRFESTPNICVMRASVDIVKAPKKTGNGYKFPNLAEACAHFGITQLDMHTAMGDAWAAAEVFRALKKIGACPDPEVHYAANRPVAAPAAVKISAGIEEVPTFAAAAPPPPIGDNRPDMIQHARDAWARLNKWLSDHPAVQDGTEARDGKLMLDVAAATLKDLRDACDTEKKPHFDAWKNAIAKYKPADEALEKLLDEVNKRLSAYARAEDAKRKAEAEAARKAAADAERIALEKIAAERDAAENASLGEIGVDLGTAQAETDAAVTEAKQAIAVAKIADRDSHVLIGGGFGKAMSLRTEKAQVIDDAAKALAAIGLTEDIKLAILKGARAYKKLKGVWPEGVHEEDGERKLR